MGGNQPLAKPFLNYPWSFYPELRGPSRPHTPAQPSRPTPLFRENEFEEGKGRARKPFPMLGRAARMKETQLRSTLSPPVQPVPPLI